MQLWHTGDLAVRAFLTLELKDAAGNWHKEPFRVDTGSDMTSMSAAYATSLNLPMPTHGLYVPLSGTLSTTIVAVRSGFLRVRVVGMDPVEHIIPCHFLGDPGTQTPAGSVAGGFPRNLLALSGVADQLRFHFDATPNPPAEPHGTMTVERI